MRRSDGCVKRTVDRVVLDVLDELQQHHSPECLPDVRSDPRPPKGCVCTRGEQRGHSHPPQLGRLETGALRVAACSCPRLTHRPHKVRLEPLAAPCGTGVLGRSDKLVVLHVRGTPVHIKTLREEALRERALGRPRAVPELVCSIDAEAAERRAGRHETEQVQAGAAVGCDRRAPRRGSPHERHHAHAERQEPDTERCRCRLAPARGRGLRTTRAPEHRVDQRRHEEENRGKSVAHPRRRRRSGERGDVCADHDHERADVRDRVQRGGCRRRIRG
mmetsp:Transcript_28566/g.93328  ORF Transcript_28566/g.93328 Transcript_28566/m.93328 type:complete len:275 (-) Transcript_28566:231-1055(-)